MYSVSCHEESYLKQVAAGIFSSFPLVTEIDFKYHRVRDDSLCKFKFGNYFFLVEYTRIHTWDPENDLRIRCYDGRITYEPLFLRRMEIEISGATLNVIEKDFLKDDDDGRKQSYFASRVNKTFLRRKGPYIYIPEGMDEKEAILKKGQPIKLLRKPIFMEDVECNAEELSLHARRLVTVLENLVHRDQPLPNADESKCQRLL